MHTFAPAPKMTRRTAPATPTTDAAAPRRQHAEVNVIRHLQRTIGNQAVMRLLRADTKNAGDAPNSEVARLGHDRSPLPFHSAAPVGAQAKLTVNTPGDIYEQEAERVAEQVMRMPEAGRSAAGGDLERAGGQNAPMQVQMRRAEANDGGAAAPPIVREVLRSPGQPLDAPMRAFMEPRFGRDFGHVRVHTGAQAAEAARAINAVAYTLGNHVVLGSAPFTPGTREQKAVLAHELAHVIQDGKNIAQRQSEAPPMSWEPAWELSFRAKYYGTIENQTKHVFKVEMSEERKGAPKYKVDLKPGILLGGTAHPGKGEHGETLTDADFVLPTKATPINGISEGKFKIGRNHATLSPDSKNTKYSIIINYADYTSNLND
jgi:Domain of unknown function (DUF4157)